MASASAEGDDAADRIVRRHADGDAISRHYLDPEAAHTAAQLREYLMALVALHAIEATAVHGDDGTLHINQIVLAQMLSFLQSKIVPHSTPFCKGLEAADGGFDAGGECGVVIASQYDRRTEADARPRDHGKTGVPGEHPIQAVEPDRDDRDPEA